MMGALKNHRDERVSVSAEELVPQDHFLRTIEATIHFDFIEEKLRPYYCENNGHPSIHPIVLFKMIFIGYFYGIRSERQLEKEIKTNIAYRWFLGFFYQIRFQIILLLVGIVVLDFFIRIFLKKPLMKLYVKRWNIVWWEDVH